MVPPGQRTGKPIPRGGPGEDAEVVQGPGFRERPSEDAPLCLPVTYWPIGMHQPRPGVVAQAQDGQVWCLVSLLPGDAAMDLQEGSETVNRLGQTMIRRGLVLAVRGAVQGTGPGQYQPA